MKYDEYTSFDNVFSYFEKSYEIIIKDSKTIIVKSEKLKFYNFSYFFVIKKGIKNNFELIINKHTDKNDDFIYAFIHKNLFDCFINIKNIFVNLMYNKNLFLLNKDIIDFNMFLRLINLNIEILIRNEDKTVFTCYFVKEAKPYCAEIDVNDSFVAFYNNSNLIYKETVKNFKRDELIYFAINEIEKFIKTGE